MASEEVLTAVRAVMSQAKAPLAYEKVFKDECMFSFDTPLFPGGLYVNLNSFQGFGKEYVALDHERTGNVLYLHQKWTKVLKPEAEGTKEDTPTQLGFGVEGGFKLDDDKYDIVKENALVLIHGTDEQRVPLPCPDLPTAVLNSIDGVLAHSGFHEQEEVAAWTEEVRESKYARRIVQESSEGKKIPPDPTKWVCEESGATENLWLNLSDGFIGSGRRHFDGSGGNGAALRHYEAMKAQGKEYPLVVKLGTITPNGADVYSYAPDEDDMVKDPLLAEHLQHWGINMMQLEKTEKSMAELQIDLNKGFEFDKITEAGAELESVHGAHLVGLKNMGNTCYMNSILQVMKEVPVIKDKYLNNAREIFTSAPSGDLSQDFPTQMVKLATALLTNRYAVPDQENAAVCVQPRMFKQLVGKGHSEFSTGRQQDAVEFFQHLLEFMTRAERAANARLPTGAGPTAAQFEFEIEERTQCIESEGVRYKTRKENVLPLEVPLDAATNKAALEEYKERQSKRQKTEEGDAGAAAAKDPEEDPVRPEVPFSACLEQLAAAETVEDYYSTALGRKGVASKQARLKTMPNFLAVQVRRYYIAEDWTPKKLDVLVAMPQEMSLEHLRGNGLQEGETELPEGEAPAEAQVTPTAHAPTCAVEPDVNIVSQLMAMGFSENGSKRAAMATGNASAEASMEWVFAHMEDADFNDPLPDPNIAGANTGASATPAGGSAATAAAADSESIMMLTSMGFTDEQAAAALTACNGSLERAADWLFSHAGDLDRVVAEVRAQVAGGRGGGGSSGSVPCFDGTGVYELVGIVSHMGSNTGCGHYVAHVRHGGQWYIFNDRKVAKSEKPPLDLGYMYLYRRKDLSA